MVEMDIKELISDLQKHMDQRFDKIESTMKETEQKGILNSENIAVIRSRLDNGVQEFIRNTRQHEEFYDKINKLEKENDSMAGGIKVIMVLLVPIFLAVVTALIRSFIG